MSRLQQIATDSRLHNRKKTNKTTAWEALVRIIETGDYGPHLSRDVGTLYQFFMPPPTTKTPKNGAEWLQIATANGDVRDFLNVIYSDGSNVYGCDGHRMHIDPRLLWPEGFYDRAGVAIASPGEYPDVMRIVRGLSNAPEMHVWDMGSAERKPSKGRRPEPLVKFQGFPGWFSEAYVVAALAGMPKPTIRVRDESDTRGRWVQGTLKIECRETGRIAVIMGMREDA